MKKKTGRSEYVYRVVVDKWPTPDGQPFAEQPLEYWEGIVDAYLNPGGALPYPEWLPDIGPWLADGHVEQPRPGYPIGPGEGDVHLLNVPTVPRRRSFTRPTAARRADDLMDWGCSVRIERALLGEWTPA